MISRTALLPEVVASDELIQQQLGFALNRAGRSEDAELVLARFISEPGDHSETVGILGRIYKDRWERAVRRGDPEGTDTNMRQAISTYLAGFRMNQRNGYPGINALTLLTIRNAKDSRIPRLFAKLTTLVTERLSSTNADYFDHATLLELSVLSKDRDAAYRSLEGALSSVREPWEPETTAHNLALLRMARDRRHERVEWARPIEARLRAGLGGGSDGTVSGAGFGAGVG
jgi:hypothetical protein